MKFLLMARALFAGLGLVRRDSTYTTCARTCIDGNLAAVSTAGCTVTSSPLGCLCSSANLEGDILDCMQDLCPDSIDFAGVSDFLDQFCIDGTQTPSPTSGGYGSPDTPSAAGYYASGAPFQYYASGAP
ncbi:hypothetical protein JMJ35_004385 [Cladonia borealis]|uniref:CFEM domain-containing protein n=1 Tax=Cladonia borealis TaxID=184061 RepID=A0AA39R3Z1_9LECA|nr:hypothetical protein JMJ35_004385 [Cladonia borealis]